MTGQHWLNLLALLLVVVVGGIALRQLGRRQFPHYQGRHWKLKDRDVALEEFFHGLLEDGDVQEMQAKRARRETDVRAG